MNIKLHEAEQCQNELSRARTSWFSPDRFSIILKWMDEYHQRKLNEYLVNEQKPKTV